MIEATLSGQVATVVLNSPATHNALTQAAMSDLTGVLRGWAETPPRALILTGTGRSFCSGASLADVAQADWSDNPLTRLCDTLEDFPAVTVARLNGGVYGGGVELALSCDFRVGVRGMKAFVPPARLGIHYEPAGIRRMIDRLGSQTARRMFLLAERFDDRMLLEAGFLDHLVEPDELDAKVDELTGTACGLAPLALRGMKQTICEIAHGTLDAAAARHRVSHCLASRDHAEGVAAMAEKRNPNFTGT